MTEKMGPNIFESLFKMTYEPCFVGMQIILHRQQGLLKYLEKPLSNHIQCCIKRNL